MHPPAWAEVGSQAELSDALGRLGLRPAQPVLVLVGAADGLAPGPAQAIAALFAGCLVPLLHRFGIAVVDGGTDSGVMALIGRARAGAAGSFPLLGVAAKGTVRLPGGAPSEGAALEPNHSHLLLVPGEHWGDEVPWIGAAASYLAGERPSLTLVAGGGRVTELDVEASLKARRPTLVLAGSGGTADRIAAALAARTLAPGRLRVLALADAEAALPGLLERLLAGRGWG